MASGAVSRKATSNTYSSTSAGNLDNNLDALLDDLQTSISTNKTTTNTSHQHNARQERIIETTTSRKSPLRSISPSQARKTTVEKYVSTGPAGGPTGIPGLEMIDKELQDVQPGQSKTIAYKQVSYHYDKQQEGQNLEPWTKTTKISKNDASIVDDFVERTFERSGTSSSRSVRDETDFAKSNKEIIYKADVSTKTIPTPITTTTDVRSSERDFKYVKETSSYTEPSPVSPRKNIKTVRTDETEELTNVEYIPASSPIPVSLAPGPNTKVTKTVKTYTYELPSQESTYSTLTKNVNIDKSASYVSIPREAEKTVSYQVEEQKSSSSNHYVPPSPSSSRVRREEKIYVERRGYRAVSPPPPPSQTSTISRSERYVQQSSNLPPAPSHDYPPSSTVTRREHVVYQTEAPPQPPPESHQRTTIKQYEEHYSASGRPPQPRPYYPSSESSHLTSTSTVYKYDEQQSLLPKPFPTSERPASPRQQPPKRIEDLMASFSDSEEVTEVMHKKTREVSTKKEVDFVPHTPPVVKSKNVAGPPVYYPPGATEFKQREEMYTMSKGGGEWSKKEMEISGGSKASGGWAKEKAAWEYGASSKNEEKTKTKKAVVPVCLPLCCALPCVIM